MDTSLAATIVSTSGAVLVGLGGMWISTSQLGKRLDDLAHRMDRLEDEFRSFKEIVSSKFSALDLEIAKLMDKRS